MTRALLGRARGGGSTWPRARAYENSTCAGFASSHTRNAVKSRSQRFAVPGTANPRRGCVSPSTSSGRSGRSGLGLSVTALILPCKKKPRQSITHEGVFFDDDGFSKAVQKRETISF